MQERECKRGKRQNTVYINKIIWLWKKIFCMAAPYKLCLDLQLWDFGVSDEAFELLRTILLFSIPICYHARNLKPCVGALLSLEIQKCCNTNG